MELLNEAVQADDLMLTVPTADDADELHRIYSDPRVWTHFPSGQHTELRETERILRFWLQGWEEQGLSMRLVREAKSREL